jgi:DNA (cytosine-5)-methyltransferase 1
MKETAKVPTNESLKALPILSFFTGGGFLDMGFEQAGFSTIWTNEFNPAFADMYEFGMGAWRKNIKHSSEDVKVSSRQSLEKLEAKTIIEEAFGAKKKPHLFGMIGGPPCPDFSIGGKNKGHKGSNGRLTKIYVKRICEIQPSFFVLENVAGLFKTSIHRTFLKRIEKQLEKSGYCLDLKVLNSLEVGVPQDRERLFVVGIKKELASKCLRRKIETKERGWFSWPIIEKYKDARKNFSWPGMDSFGGKPPRPTDIPEELMVYSLLNGTHPEKQANGLDIFKAYSSRFSTVKEGDTKRKSFKRLHRYRFSPTVCYGHNEVHLHPWEKRRLSVREAMRIQGIPDEYALPAEKPLSAKFAMVSNGVPVPLAYHTALALKDFLDRAK